MSKTGVEMIDGPLVRGLVEGTNVSIDDTDPHYPVISASGGGGGGVGAVCKVRQTVAQNVLNNTMSTLTFGEVVHGDAALWDAANPDRITFVADGIYDVAAGWAHDGASSTATANVIGITLYDSAGVALSDREHENLAMRTFAQSAQTTAQFEVAAGMYVVCRVQQGTGATRATTPARCWMTATQVR